MSRITKLLALRFSIKLKVTFNDQMCDPHICVINHVWTVTQHIVQSDRKRCAGRSCNPLSGDSIVLPACLLSAARALRAPNQADGRTPRGPAVTSSLAHAPETNTYTHIDI